MANVQLPLILVFSVLSGTQLKSYHLWMPEVRVTLDRHPLCRHPVSTYYVLGTVPEVGNVQVTQRQPLSSTGSWRKDE